MEEETGYGFEIYTAASYFNLLMNALNIEYGTLHSAALVSVHINYFLYW